MPLGGVSRNAYVGTLAEAGPVHPELERPYGPSVPAMFATVARAHMDRYDTSADHLAAVAIQNRKAAAHHPNAHYREPIDTNAYRTSRMIADPLRLLDCAPVSDGGGAIIVATSDRVFAILKSKCSAPDSPPVICTSRRRHRSRVSVPAMHSSVLWVRLESSVTRSTSRSSTTVLRLRCW
jgi:acetyl-CoA acetyltransferase